MKMKARHPVLTVILFALAAALFPACGNGSLESMLELGEISGVSGLTDRFSPAHSVTIVPDRFWEADDEAGMWGFRGYANLLVYVEDHPGKDLVLTLEPAEVSRSCHFTVRWDDVALWSAPRQCAPGGEAISIPKEMLGPGRHRLEIRRDMRADTQADRLKHDNLFTAIRYSVGEESGSLMTGEAVRLELFRAFLQDGVVGATKVKHGGWLVEGPQAAAAFIRVDEPSTFAFHVKAFGSPGALFSIELDGASLTATPPPDGEGIEFELPRGVHRVVFRASGEDTGLFLWGAPHQNLTGRQRQGPVILVTLDTTRKDALSPYGGPSKATPNIAGLAEQGTVYTDAWATSPWTLPSHASIFTGLYPSRHRAGVTDARLDGSFETVADIFRDAGFRTAGFAAGELCASHWGIAQGFQMYRDPDGFETRGDRLVGYVEEYLDRYEEDPLFLFLNLFDPHALYSAPAEYEELFGVPSLRERLAGVPIWGDLAAGKGDAWGRVVEGEAATTPDVVEFVRAAYLAEVAFMDAQLGRIIASLKGRSLFDTAMIVVVGDHGEFLGEGQQYSHAVRLDPELTAVPLIIKWPGQLEPRRISGLVSQVDLFSTMAKAAISLPSPMDGLTLSADRPDPEGGRTRIFMEEHQSRIHPLPRKLMIAPHLYGIQEPGYRQDLWQEGSRCYRRDRGEWVDEACSPGWRDRLEDVKAMAAFPVAGGAEDQGEEIRDDIRQRLKALGYIR